MSDKDELIDQVNYRGFSFSVWLDRETDNYYTIIAGKPLYLKTKDYQHYFKHFIDKNLGLIHEWNKDTYLCYFQNGSFLDIKLVKDNRVLKIFLVSDLSAVNHESIIKECEKSLNFYDIYEIKRLKNG